MKKKYVPGTISLLLCVLALGWSYCVPALNDLSLGDIVLTSLKIPTWSGDTDGNTRIHYTFLSSLLFLIPALVLGIIHKKDWGAKVGTWVSGTVIAFVTIMTLAVIIF